MDGARWTAISDLAALASETAPEDREALLSSHPELRGEVESLLRFWEDGTGPLDQLPALPPPDTYEGRRIGPYRVVRQLGSGGMGVVLLAERDDPQFPQQVAIKLARAAFQSEFFQRRFVEERRILASLEHPLIARLLDGGVTEDGTPYLVMQYVEGVPLDEWCASQPLSIRACIELILRVSAAVEHAHEHLIVHRDLKPGNILVTPSGEPMLLDFGTARLLDSSGPSGATRTDLPMLTARYASPEQIARLSGSTRSDVYSLGVILYQLLTGQWPYEADLANTAAVLRAVSEQQPRLPSRSTPDPALRRQLTGDLDAILLKALDKSPERRYGTVQQFTADLRRHLDNQPVEARQLTWTYRSGRFLRRHRWAAAAAAIVVLTLAAATGYSIRQAQIANREREKAVQVAMFLENLLGASGKGQVSPLATGGRDLKVVDVIETAAARVGAEFKNSPDIEVGLRSTIGSALMALGAPDRARPHVERAVELSTKLYGDNHAASTRALTARGRLSLASGQYASAQSDLERALVWHRGRNSPDLSFQHSLLAEAYFRQANLPAARAHWEAALAAMRKQFGTQHVATSTMISNLAVVSDDAGDAVAAEKYFAEAASILRALPGPPGNLVYPLFGLQRAHFFRGEYAQAKALCEEAHRHALKNSGPRHPNTAQAMMLLALAKGHLGEPDAVPLARENLALQRSIYPPEHLEVSRGLASLSRVLILQGAAAEAEPLLRESLRIARKIFPQDNWRPAESQILLGAALATLGKRTEAESALREGLREMRATLPRPHPRVVEAERIARRCGEATPSACTLALLASPSVPVRQ